MHARAPRARVKISTRIFGLPMLKLGFAALKFAGRILGNHLSNPRGPSIPGVLQYPALVHVYERQIPDPVNCLSGKFPGVSRGGGGGGMVTPGIDSCINLV
jgi:hypothetical protein